MQSGDAPLYVAAAHNCTECVEVLLSYGAELNLQYPVRCLKILIIVRDITVINNKFFLG